MESLFDKVYENTQPLRKFEPLIRFDLEGNPYPRRPLDTSAQIVANPIVPTKKIESQPNKDQKNSIPSKSVEPTTNDLKRPAPSNGLAEPAKKKQQVPGKQQKLTQFFMKKQ